MTEQNTVPVPQNGVDANTITDYTYDNNGNLEKDLNKNIGTSAEPGIQYNYLNLPWKISVRTGNTSAEKGNITYIYDATGNKQRKITFEAASSSNQNTQKTTTTSYWGAFVYETVETIKDGVTESKGTALQFISHEEGRIREVVTTVNGQPSTAYHFDYL